MSTRRSAMLAELGRDFVPALQHRGFTGSGQHFRRIRGGVLQLIAIRYERDDAGFGIELACCALQQIVDDHGLTSWPGQVSAWSVAMARLGPHARLANPASALGGSEFPGWRNQPNGTIARETDLVLGARQAVAALAAIEAWFEAHRELAPPGGDAAR